MAEAEDKARIAISVDKATHRKIKIMAIENDTTVQDLVGSAVEHAFGEEEDAPKKGGRKRRGSTEE